MNDGNNQKTRPAHPEDGVGIRYRKAARTGKNKLIGIGVPEVDGSDSEWAPEVDLTQRIQAVASRTPRPHCELEAATGEVETVLKNCKTPTTWKPRDPMKWIADAATGAWERLGGEPPALGKYSVSPLVAFVQLALQGIGFTGKHGQPYSDETISDHLNERIGEEASEGAIRVQSVPQSTLSNGFRIRSLLPVFTRRRSLFTTMTEVIAHTIADAVKISGIGRTTLYELIAAKKIDARKAGNRTLIPAESLRAYIAGLPKADIRTGQRSAA